MNERIVWTVVEERRGLFEEDLAAILEAYLRNSEAELCRLGNAWEDGDLERLRRSVHSLKGASRDVGALALASLCAELEELARQGCTDRVPAVLEKLRAELREVRDAVVAAHPIH